MRNSGKPIRINRVNTGAFILENNGKKRRVNSVDETGFPDMVGCYDGKFFAIELKVPRGRIRWEQVDRLEDMYACGAYTAVCCDTESVERFFKDIEQGIRKNYAEYWATPRYEPKVILNGAR